MSWTQPAFEAIAELVRLRSGLSFVNRRDSAELGICRAMARARTADLARYVELIAGDDQALSDLMDELTIGETYFFREPGHFRFIQKTVLPDLMRRRGQHGMRVWSAGCASGEEAYSLAILLDQAGVGRLAHLVATDISGKALAKARQAIYDAWSLRGDSASSARPFLAPLGKRYQLDERIRRRVSFTHLNLALDAYPSFANGLWGMDLILCRNVLIYLEPETVRRVARRLHETLAEGGWLISASSDPPLWEFAPFEVVSADEGLFYRRVPVGAGENSGSADSAQRSGVESIAWEPAFPAEPPALEATLELPVLPMNEPVPTSDALADARTALAQGEYRRAVRLTAKCLEDALAAVVHVRALANLESEEAERACARAAAAHPFCAELHYLHAVLLLSLARTAEAIQAVRRVLYLDRTLAAAHFTLGSILRDRGDRTGARRSFRNAQVLCAARPAGEAVPLADGEQAGRLTEIASRELALLDGLGDNA